MDVEFTETTVDNGDRLLEGRIRHNNVEGRVLRVGARVAAPATTKGVELALTGLLKRYFNFLEKLNAPIRAEDIKI